MFAVAKDVNVYYNDVVNYGKAFDADGKLLYEKRPVAVTENGNESTTHKWVAVD